MAVVPVPAGTGTTWAPCLATEPRRNQRQVLVAGSVEVSACAWGVLRYLLAGSVIIWGDPIVSTRVSVVVWGCLIVFGWKSLIISNEIRVPSHHLALYPI